MPEGDTTDRTERFDVWLVVPPSREQPSQTITSGGREHVLPQSAMDVVRRAAAVTKEQSIGAADAMRILAAVPAVLVVDVDGDDARRVAAIVDDAGGRCEVRPGAPGLVVLDPRTMIDPGGAPTPALVTLMEALAELDLRASAHNRAHPIDPEQVFEAMRNGKDVAAALGDVPRFREGDDLVDELIDQYECGDPRTRTWLRDQVLHLHRVLWLVNGRIGRELRRFRDGDATASLDGALAAVCVSDLQPDYRDTFLALGDLWLAAVATGLDPAPAFERMSHLAVSERTEKFLANFTESAFFASSVAPHL